MFLQVMNQEDKEKFLELVYHIANIDGEFAEEEQAIIENYKMEMGLDEVKNTTDLDGLINYFSAREATIKKIVLFEAKGLIMADNKIDAAEEKLMKSMEMKFGFDPQIIDGIDRSVKDLQGVYDQIYSVIFD